MTQNSNTLAPMNLLDPAADAWLIDMAEAANLAKLHLDQARLTVRSAYLRPNGASPKDLGQAMNSPTGIVVTGHHKAAHDAEWAAQAAYRQIVGWYAQSAALALEAVLAGGKVTAREMERRTVHRLMPNGRPGQENDWWDGPFRPPLPTPDAMVTGHEDIDQQVRATYEPLATAYSAASDAAAAEEDFELRPGGYVADWEASAAHDAQARAEGLWELLHAWAEAVAFAALYGRSRARGHQPIEQESDDTDE
jgi:hypothetical protein